MTKKAAKGFSVARAYAFSNEKETQGVWFDFEGGSRVQVARYGNPEQLKMERKLEQQMQHKLNSKNEDEAQEARRDMNRKIFAKTVLLGWEGFLAEDGETDLPYTTENAEDLLNYPEFFNAVFEFASDLSKFRKYQEEDAVKN